MNKNDKVANGSVDVRIRGYRGGVFQQLVLVDVADPLDSGLAFKFKHFRRS